MSELEHSQRTARTRRRGHQQRGQGMTEYILIVLLTVVLALLVPVPGTNRTVMELFLDAYKSYYDSFYFVLNMPLP
jgi:hypothetical protein